VVPQSLVEPSPLATPTLERALARARARAATPGGSEDLQDIRVILNEAEERVD
jgi:hypothetical protein